MIGDREVLEFRKAGGRLVDGVLHVHTDGIKVNRDWIRFGERAEVGIEPTDYPELLDLRFALGLRVHVEGTDSQRVDAVAAAFSQAKAARVLTTVFAKVNGRQELVRMTDTKGVLQWQA